MTEGPSPLISVVIPTWNRADLVLECLASLTRQEGVSLQILVVDDGSTDDTEGRVKRAFPQARLLRLADNRGFARAANVGIRAATSEWVLLLNNDVTLAPGCLLALVQVAQRAGAAMAAPILFWRDDPERIYSAGDRLRRDGRPEPIGFRLPLRMLDTSERPFGVTAACGLFHRRVFDTAGLLEESFVAYFEDVDLCFRARLAGLSAVVAPSAIAYHVGSASILENTWWRSAQCYRNHALLLIRNMPGSLLWKNVRPILRERCHQWGMVFGAARAKYGALRAGAICVYYAGWLAVSIPRALSQRRTIQRQRKISPESLLDLMDDMD